MAFPPIE
jgi:hypothetical protein